MGHLIRFSGAPGGYVRARCDDGDFMTLLEPSHTAEDLARLQRQHDGTPEPAMQEHPPAS